MLTIWAIIKHDLRVFLSRRSNLPGLLITPVIMTVIIGLVSGGAFGGGAVIRRLDVIDLDATQASAQFLDAVRLANPGLTLCPMDNTAKDVCSFGDSGALTESGALIERVALDRVADSTSLALLEIPAGVGASLAGQQPAMLTLRSSSSFGASQPAQQAVQAALAQVNAAFVASQVGLSAIDQLTGQPSTGDQAAQLKGNLYRRALAMQQEKHVTVAYALSGSGEPPSTSESLQNGLGQSVPGMGSMFVLMTIFGGMAALIVERQQWTLQRLAVMPVARSTLLAGKILARFCLGLLQFTIVLVVGALLGMDFGKDPAALLLLVIVYTLSVTAISFAIGPALKNPAQASGLGMLLTLTLAPLGGAWWPLDISPRFMQIAGHFTPVGWAMEGFTALTYNGARLSDIWLQLAVLLGMAAVAFLIAIPRFRYQVD
jgi:ABC-type multidrug transport system permease subunit